MAQKREQPTGPRARVEVEFEQPHLLGPLFGEFDRNLVAIEDRLGVYIAARGNKVQIEGDPEDAARAREVSGRRRVGSSLGSGRRMIPAVLPVRALISSASWTMVSSWGLPGWVFSASLDIPSALTREPGKSTPVWHLATANQLARRHVSRNPIAGSRRALATGVRC